MFLNKLGIYKFIIVNLQGKRKQKRMKSIKEKAEEYSSGYMNLDRQLVSKQALEFGANYVLDEIEKLTNNQNWCAFPKQSHKELKELIEQLKK